MKTGSFTTVTSIVMIQTSASLCQSGPGHAQAERMHELNRGENPAWRWKTQCGRKRGPSKKNKQKKHLRTHRDVAGAATERVCCCGEACAPLAPRQQLCPWQGSVLSCWTTRLPPGCCPCSGPLRSGQLDPGQNQDPGRAVLPASPNFREVQDGKGEKNNVAWFFCGMECPVYPSGAHLRRFLGGLFP